MDFVLILIFGYVILTTFIIMRGMDKPDSVIYKEKLCPPHKWTLKKQPETGDNETYYMVCENCNQFPAQED